jgi:hypothetical protein
MTQTYHAQAASSWTRVTILKVLLNGWLMEACCATSAKDFVLVASPYNFVASRMFDSWNRRKKGQEQAAITGAGNRPRLEQGSARLLHRSKAGFNNVVTQLRNEDHDGLVWLGWVQDSIAMVKN